MGFELDGRASLGWVGEGTPSAKTQSWACARWGVRWLANHSGQVWAERRGGETGWVRRLLVSQHCCYKAPWPGWLEQQEFIVSVLEARSLRWQCWQGWFLLGVVTEDLFRPLF